MLLVSVCLNFRSGQSEAIKFCTSLFQVTDLNLQLSVS